MVLADLDHFKSINDRFGHAVGDRVLQIFAETASAKLGAFDLIGRLGGEEFAMVIYDCGRDKALAIAERIRPRSRPPPAMSTAARSAARSAWAW